MRQILLTTLARIIVDDTQIISNQHCRTTASSVRCPQRLGLQSYELELRVRSGVVRRGGDDMKGYTFRARAINVGDVHATPLVDKHYAGMHFSGIVVATNTCHIA